MEFVPRFLPTPEQSFFLFGPRGTGKTTWLRQRFPMALHLDLLQPELFRELSARPEGLRERLLASPTVETVIVDEVQRVPELLTVVHDLLERPGAPQFILTGSSARKLRRGGVDLLAGRALLRTLHPFMAAELSNFNLDYALHLGLVPLVVDSPNPEDVLQAYASLYLEQEIQVEGWVRNIGSFARFLEAVSFSHAAVLNVSNIARECQVGQKTVAGYLEVLEDLLLCYRLPVFRQRARRQTVAHPKFYLFDTGVFRSLRPTGPLDRQEEIAGASLEGLVAQHLRAWTAYTTKRAELFYWRTRGGSEVDFIVYGPAGFWAVEVSNTARVRPADLRSLRSFKKDYPEATTLFLYRGQDRLLRDSHLCIPVNEFLTQLRPDQALDAGL